ncbi:hypothetical protein PF003_g9257 [Phytophthora fragariae]|uniref:Secreted protein n=1 Tax=Phytophthora fragariae TaxID=53985 RepID=A0A6A3DCT9_9STRA|nr:hypothetical protein PF003_g9250 [Phytophthora fragariae]KAE8907065.1 hypothetical protein PF003_g9257 [Phytophthora fragariae]KAE8918096.1 hypothetical protein PF009_g31588 [Phytophthora fragariae]
MSSCLPIAALFTFQLLDCWVARAASFSSGVATGQSRSQWSCLQCRQPVRGGVRPDPHFRGWF